MNKPDDYLPMRPIPITERPLLKSDPFYDAAGRCWCGHAACTDKTGDFSAEIPHFWELREPCPQDDALLPHWALPLPLEVD